MRKQKVSSEQSTKDISIETLEKLITKHGFLMGTREEAEESTERTLKIAKEKGMAHF